METVGEGGDGVGWGGVGWDAPPRSPTPTHLKGAVDLQGLGQHLGAHVLHQVPAEVHLGLAFTEMLVRAFRRESATDSDCRDLWEGAGSDTRCHGTWATPRRGHPAVPWGPLTQSSSRSIWSRFWRISSSVLGG